MEKIKKEVVIIGGGPGGYVAAIRLAQMGKKVALIDKGSLGGVCLNWGCIPSKALIHVAKLYEEMEHAAEVGITVSAPKIDLAITQKWKTSVVQKLTSGIGQIVKGNGGEIIFGTATFVSPKSVEVLLPSNQKTLVEFDQAIVACGSKTIEIPGFKIDGTDVVDSKDALDWTAAPKRLAVIGGGVIGMEIGMLFQKFGTQVTVVELSPNLLPGTDTDVSKALEKICTKRKITLHLDSKALGYEKSKNELILKVETKKGPVQVPCDKILLAVGRAPNGTMLGLEKIGVTLDRGRVPVNKHMQTNLAHIYAIGDVAGQPLLAHKASKEGIVAAEHIAGHHGEYDVRAMPGAIFTDPEIATVGLSEDDCKKQNIEYFVGQFPFAASGRALSTRATDGFVKVIGNKSNGLLLGCHIIGPHASDLIAEATLAIEMGATVEDMALTVHPHPTTSESVMEACEDALGLPIHTMKRKAKA
jgi:dihydrolipoamide dehydrogenase